VSGLCYGQLPSLDSLWLRKPGTADFLDQVGEGFGLELGAAQPFLGSHDEDLVGVLTVKRFSCSRSGCRIIWQTSC